jgi:IPTL-CTERM motif
MDMSTLLRKTLPSLIALAGTGLSANVFAGSSVGSIVYGSGDSTPVPTLGGSALIVLAILLAVVAFRILRTQQHKGVNLVVALTAVTALASGVGGIRLVSDANALIPVGTVNMSSESGGSVQLSIGANEVTNVTKVPLSILQINVANGCFIDNIRPNGGGNGGIGDAIEAQANGGGNFVGYCDDNPSTTVPPGDFCGLVISCDT